MYPRRVRWECCLFFCAGAIALAGCGPKDEITKYSVVRNVDSDSPTPTKPGEKIPEAERINNTNSGLAYETPEGWVAGKAGGFRKAAFEVHDEGRKVEITAIDLPGSAGNVLDNVNRWRGQIQLTATKQADLDKQLKKLPVGDATGQFVELIGPDTASPRQAILGVILPVGSKTWFFKLQGDSTLAEKEKTHFEEFVRSIKFRDQ